MSTLFGDTGSLLTIRTKIFACAGLRAFILFKVETNILIVYVYFNQYDDKRMIIQDMYF
jgi:hypothetical protein